MNAWRRCLKVLQVLGVIVLGCGVIGCAHGPSGARTAAPNPKPDEAQVAPFQFGAAPARIASVSAQYRFVVVDFSSRSLPSLGTKLLVYRDGRRVGVIQITEPVRAQFATADILEGDLRVGDEAR